MNTLGDELPKEIERCQHILSTAREIGPGGWLLSYMLTSDLREAVNAISSGDTVAMIRVYQKLKGYKE